jgi:hypothetical protein
MDLSKLTDEELITYRDKGLKSLSDDAIMRLAGKKPVEVESEGIRTFLQGTTFGLADEIEAGVRSVLPDDFGGGEYDKIRDQLRSDLAAYKKENPNTALTQEIAGSLLSAIPAFFMTGGASAPLTFGNVAKTGVLYGGLTGYGTSESKDVVGQLVDTGKGAGIGGLTSVVGKSVASAAGDFVNFTKSKFGSTASQAVQREIQRLQQQTGKTKEEILFDLSEGRLMSDNKTLSVALKNYVNEGGKSGRAVLGRTKARAAETRSNAQDALKSIYADVPDSNVTRAFKMSSDELRQGESEAYKRIFANGGGEASEDIQALMNESGKIIPSLAKKLNEVYQVKKLTPLYQFDESGSVDLYRVPTLQDAEEMYRMLRDVYTTKDAWRENAVLTEAVNGIKNQLQKSIDTQSPLLAQTRQNWAKMASAKEAFEQGRKAVNMPSEDLEILVESLKAKPESLNALKQGFMAGVNNKLGVTKTTFRNIADQDTKLGQNARIIAGDDFTRSVKSTIQTAADAQEIKQFMPKTAGSPTSALQQERAAQGLAQTAQEYAQAGDVGAVFNIFARGVDKWNQRHQLNLTDEQKLQVVNTIFSNQPKTVERMLKQPEVLQGMQKNVDKYIDYLIKPAQFQAAQMNEE